MAAGDLENIVLTSPDSAAQKSARVRNIIWRDETNVNRSVKEVYWSPDGISAKLVWQRDHSPIAVKYKTVLQTGDQANGAYTAIKFTAQSTEITKLKIWSMIDGNHSVSRNIYVYNSDGTFFKQLSQDATDIAVSTETLNVDDQDQTVYTAEWTNLNNKGLTGLTIGNDYYVFVNDFNWGNLWTPIFFDTGSGDYKWHNGYNAFWKLGQSGYNLSECLDNNGTDKPKFEVNGVQV